MAEEQKDFKTLLYEATDLKAKWFDTEILPKVQENYRIHLTCVRNLFDALVRRSLITPDPYKNDNKVTDIVCPDTSEFGDNERSIVLGLRLSNYESVIDYICNYMRFTVEQITMEKIKKLMELNQTFTWSGLTISTGKANTRFLSSVISQLKNNAPQLTLSMINDSTSKSVSTLKEINESLKLLAAFQREKYKTDVRRFVLDNKQFNKDKLATVPGVVGEIKRLFPSTMRDRPFVADLISEIGAEEAGPDKLQRQQTVLASLKVTETKSTVKKEAVDTHESLMDVIRLLGSLHDQYIHIYEKLNNNSEVLQSELKSFLSNIKKLFRKMFGLPDPPIFYEIVITDKTTNIKRKEKISFNDFMASLRKRIKQYSSFAIRHSPGYNKVSSQADNVIFDFLNRQIIENNHLYVQFTAFDEFFKNTVQGSNRSKIKGLSMELTAVKNIQIKVKQARAEYTAYIEETEQMKKLGIKDV